MRIRVRPRTPRGDGSQRSGGCEMWGRGPPLTVKDLPAVGALADANLDAAPLLVVAELVADTAGPIARRADDHHVRDRERRGQLDHASRLDLGLAHPARVLHRARLAVLLDKIEVLDHDAPLARIGLDDAALLAAVLAREHLNEVTLADLHAVRHQRTSGASETIFMKFFSRSSRATGPKMRVPRGLFWASMITAAFSSKAIEVPSSRPKGFFVRTTTALTTSPFLIVPWGVAVFTVPTMTSPTRA